MYYVLGAVTPCALFFILLTIRNMLRGHRIGTTAFWFVKQYEVLTVDNSSKSEALSDCLHFLR